MHSWGQAHECSEAPGGARGGHCEAGWGGRHVKALLLHLAVKDGNKHWRHSVSSSHLGLGDAMMEESPCFTQLPLQHHWFMSQVQVSKLQNCLHVRVFAEAHLKHLSLRSSSFPALKCWFVLFLCQSVQALSLKCVFLGPPCIQRETSHRRAGGVHRQDFQRM